MASQDFSLYAGDSKTIQVSVTDASGNPYDLTGATIKWVAVNNNLNILSKNTDNSGVIITNPTQGQFTIVLTSKDTTNLMGNYTHEARVVDQDGNSAIIFTGDMAVQQSYV